MSQADGATPRSGSAATTPDLRPGDKDANDEHYGGGGGTGAAVAASSPLSESSMDRKEDHGGDDRPYPLHAHDVLVQRTARYTPPPEQPGAGHGAGAGAGYDQRRM
eukprot:CAMPEP_0181026764 /NCGR_PEP_ID=MMETSP1070-20121207/3816_1 /TAXON_ID=265543 /ORGANISM="Minutocellus polymorphus, Strain NH13" /LENGTH=105 /DNA_ID=CAMNT_0023103983 /DNA_START=432 /DNA_END=746 /DNA_ORIENTATION=-